MRKYKIAIITAFIGNGGTSGELKITSEAQAELDAYGVDIYRFNNDNVDLLKPYFEPSYSKKELVNDNLKTKIANVYYRIKYKQSTYPSKQDNHTRLIAKIPKILFYTLIPQKYDYYIWLDSKFTIEEHWLKYVLWLIERYGENDIITSNHSERNSVKEELHFMLELMKKEEDYGLRMKYSMIDMLDQFKFYSQNKYFNDNCLYELTMILYSKNILQNRSFLDRWYAHNYYLSIQDQLSFPYLIKKYKVKVKGIKQRVFDMPFTKHEYSSQ